MLKNDFSCLKRPYADIELLVVASAKVSGVAMITTSSPNLERQVRALVKSEGGKQKAWGIAVRNKYV